MIFQGRTGASRKALVCQENPPLYNLSLLSWPEILGETSPWHQFACNTACCHDRARLLVGSKGAHTLLLVAEVHGPDLVQQVGSHGCHPCAGRVESGHRMAEGLAPSSNPAVMVTGGHPCRSLPGDNWVWGSY